MKLYLVRHGESEANIHDLYHFPDTPLSKEGVRQSKVLAKKLAKFPFDLIYSSDLLRARQTADAISEKTGKEVKTTPLLREFKKPSRLWGKSDDYEYSMIYVKLQKENFNNPDWKWDDDESFNEFKSRVIKILGIFTSMPEDNRIVVVSHGAIIKMITAVAVMGGELTPRIFWKFWHNTWIKNTGMTVLEYKGGKWTLVAWNYAFHLGE